MKTGIWSFLTGRVRPKVRERPLRDWRLENEARIERLRRRGVRIGEGCVLHTDEFSTEPYLIELGRHVGVAGGVRFLTHDASPWLIRETRPNVQHFGRIVVGDNTYIGEGCILLPGTRVGAHCLLGAGSVIRGEIPENSLVIGNPARVVGRASLAVARLLASPDTFDSLHFSEMERRAMLERHFGLDPAPHPLS